MLSKKANIKSSSSSKMLLMQSKSTKRFASNNHVTKNSLPKKLLNSLTNFHTRSMIEFQDEKKDFLEHHKSVLEDETIRKNKFNFTVQLPCKKNNGKVITAQRESLNSTGPIRSTVKYHYNNTSVKVSDRFQNDLSDTKQQQNIKLLTKLKEVIDQMKQKQTKQKDEIKKLYSVNQKLQFQNRQLIQTLKKYEMRDKDLTVRIKSLETEKKCSDHEIIIQSLKKVIDGQLQKIIQLEKMRIVQESETRNSKDFDFFDELTNKSTPCFPPSTPPHKYKKHLIPTTQQSQNYNISNKNHQNKIKNMNINVQLVDTFRKKPNLHLEQKSRADQILSEIENCLDSLSRRRRQLL